MVRLFNPPIFIGSWFGSGFLSPAPGTWGTIAALPFALGLLGVLPLWIYLWITAAIFTLGLWSAHEFAKQSGIADDKRIVIDEVVGMMIALIPTGLNPWLVLLAFLAFRAFDILKPWPVSLADKRLKGSWGVMLDDVWAGIMAGFSVLGAAHVIG